LVTFFFGQRRKLPARRAEPGALQRIGEASRVKPESLNETHNESQQRADFSPTQDVVPAAHSSR
jgi:hypothetical protein